MAKLRQIISLGDDNAYDLVYLWLLAPIVDVGKEYAVLLELSVNIDEHMGCGHAWVAGEEPAYPCPFVYFEQDDYWAHCLHCRQTAG